MHQKLEVVYNFDGRAAAELSAAEKDALSHRGQAVRAALEALRS